MINKSFDYFKKKDISVYLNEPYKGTIVPLKYYQKNSRVQSIMLEVNKKLYLSENGEKNENFGLVRHIIRGFIEMLTIIEK